MLWRGGRVRGDRVERKPPERKNGCGGWLPSLVEAPFQLVDGSDADRRAQRIRRNRGTANYGDGNRSAGATRGEGEEGEEEGEAFHG